MLAELAAANAAFAVIKTAVQNGRELPKQARPSQSMLEPKKSCHDGQKRKNAEA